MDLRPYCNCKQSYIEKHGIKKRPQEIDRATTALTEVEVTKEGACIYCGYHTIMLKSDEVERKRSGARKLGK